MRYRVINLLESPLLKGAKLLAGEDQLEQNIRWAHTVELSEQVENVPKNVLQNDLMVVTGPILKEDPPAILDALAKIAVEKKVSAMIVFQKEYLQEVPQAVIRTMRRNKIPLIFVQEPQPPLTDLISEITYGIMNNDSINMRKQGLLYDIIADDVKDEEAFYSRAKFHSLDLRVPHQAIYIKYSLSKVKGSSAALIRSIEMTCNQVFGQYYANLLMVPEHEAFVYLIPENPYRASVVKIAGQLLEGLQALSTSLNVVIGIGGLYERVAGFHRSIVEAKEITEVLRVFGQTNTYQTIQKMIFPVFLLENKDNLALKMIYDRTVLRLCKFEQAGNPDLVDTLDVYLSCDKNISVAAEQLYIHRNTLRNRLQRIEQVTQKHLDNRDDCLELTLALYLHKFISNT